MKKYFIIKPRKSLKSILAVYEYNKDPNNSLLVLMNSKLVEKTIDKYPNIYKENIITINAFENFIVGKKFDTLILDDYNYYNFKNKKIINDYITKFYEDLDHIIAFNTIQNYYITDPLFNLVKYNKNNIKNFDEFIKKMFGDKNNLTLNDLDKLDFYYHSFISDMDTKLLIDQTSDFNKFYNKYNEILNKDFIEILGKNG